MSERYTVIVENVAPRQGVAQMPAAVRIGELAKLARACTGLRIVHLIGPDGKPVELPGQDGEQ